MLFIIKLNIVMKKLIGLKNINVTFTESINDLYSKLQDNLKDIKQEYQQNIIDDKVKLLIAICNGEGLDINEMKNKYLKLKELDNFEPENLNKNNPLIDDNLLDKIKINDKDYYYEPINNGIVYNTDNQPVGIYKNGSIVINKD
jgi:hypothetical protein